jgi:hypothetical protein
MPTICVLIQLLATTFMELLIIGGQAWVIATEEGNVIMETRTQSARTQMKPIWNQIKQA